MSGRALDVLLDALTSLATRPLRAALSALAIALAVATIVLVTSIPASSDAALQRRLTALGSDVLVAQAAAVDGAAPTLPADAVGMVRRIGPVTAAAAVGDLGVPVARTAFDDPNRTVGITALVVRGDLLHVVHGAVRSGAFLDAVSGRLSGVVLGSTAARWLGIERAEPGSGIQVLVGGQPFTVVGVLAAMPLHPELEQAVFVGAASARTALHSSGRPTVVYLRAIESQIPAVSAVLPRTLAPELPGLIDVSRPSDVLSAKRAVSSAFTGLAVALAGVSLLVGGIGISNTMVVAVLERRREIGVRRALGARRRDVAALVLAEAVALSLLGAVGGLLLGAAGAAAWAVGHGWPPVIAVPVAAAGALGAAVVGCVAGAQPAARAAGVSPTEALAAP